jgi:hypothetical protein
MVNKQKERQLIIYDMLGLKPHAYQHRKLPCRPTEPKWRDVQVQRSSAIEGILFVKLMKVGGSTAAGVSIRMARMEAKRRRMEDSCQVRFTHGRKYPVNARAEEGEAGWE